MDSEAAEGGWNGVAAELSAVREALRAPGPGVLNNCRPILAASVERLQRLIGTLRNDAAASIPGNAGEVRKMIRDIDRLMAHALDFHSQWGRLRDSMLGGYTANGEPAALQQSAARVSIRG